MCSIYYRIFFSLKVPSWFNVISQNSGVLVQIHFSPPQCTRRINPLMNYSHESPTVHHCSFIQFKVPNHYDSVV